MVLGVEASIGAGQLQLKIEIQNSKDISMGSHALKHEPLDAYNLALTENLHPAGWVNPAPADRYNMVVIGAGTAGLVTAAGAAILGAKVALGGRELVGGGLPDVRGVASKGLIRP